MSSTQPSTIPTETEICTDDRYHEAFHSHLERTTLHFFLLDRIRREHQKYVNKEIDHATYVHLLETHLGTERIDEVVGLVQKELRLVNGMVDEPEERDESPPPVKRFKRASDAAFAELVCPITHLLPTEPVTAEDGRVYERRAIEEWLERQSRSPWTNKYMGPSLRPAPHISNMIRTMVESGALTGPTTSEWQQLIEAERSVKALEAKCETGCSLSMYELGGLYASNEHLKDDKKAFHWFEKSFKKCNWSATTMIGQFTIEGRGTDPNVPYGMMYLMMAGHQGSRGARAFLAKLFVEGLYGLPVNMTWARTWARLVGKGTINDITKERQQEIDTWLRDNDINDHYDT